MSWYKFFFVTQGEKRGTQVLLVLVFILLMFRTLLAQHQAAVKPQNLAEMPQLVADSNTISHKSVSAKNDHFIVELNAADTTQLKQLRGIGSGFAKMIVNYRTKLGGFYCKEQLLEVYHFPEETFRKIEHQLVVDTTLITPIFLNTADINQLKRHPYIRYFQAKSLYDNRISKKDKRYNTIKDIVLDRDVTSEFLRRIAPYLSFR